MKYPKFLKEKDTIGICALSDGVGDKLESFDKAIKALSKHFNTKETKSVRNRQKPSNTAKIRAEEFDLLVNDKDVNMIMIARGGDHLIEILPYVDFHNFKNNPKWVMGYSDPTSLLYTITTKYDIASLYGCNAGSYDSNHAYIDMNLNYLKGNITTQKSYKNYMYTQDWLNDLNEYNGKVKWIMSKDINISGRCIGGCIDVLNDIFHSSFDYTSEFIERYKEEGIVWYFDNFALSSKQFYETLLLMKNKNYFTNTKLVIVGRVLFPNEDTLTYKKALQLVLEDIPYILEADIGHVSPKMTMINGAIISVIANENKQEINFELR